MLVLNTNMGSLNAQRALTTVQESQQSAMERLSSGSRINPERQPSVITDQIEW
ncbi:MAG: hypothetical protein HOE82_08160 [Gammaproteobacteria bacterium]|nr:hypothetical protein [Gammaproteobacteria bacterium]